MSVIRFGFGLEAEVRAVDVRQSPRGMKFKLEAKGESFLVRTPLIGRFNVYNILAITSDNPRSEDPESIIREIESAMGSARRKSVIDRAEAIRIAVHAAGEGDIVLIAGKGHENHQQFADRTVDFDDRNEVRRAIEERPKPEEPRR